MPIFVLDADEEADLVLEPAPNLEIDELGVFVIAVADVLLVTKLEVVGVIDVGLNVPGVDDDANVDVLVLVEEDD